MNLTNETIKHAVFGKGTVIRQEGDKLYVRFSEQHGVKKFIYPDAFENFLKQDNDTFAAVISEDLQAKKLRIIAENAEKQKRFEEEFKSRIEEEKSIAKPARKSTKSKSK